MINKVRTAKAYSEKSVDISDLSYVLCAAAGGRFNVDEG